MKASEFQFQKNDLIVISHDYGEMEVGMIVRIPDGPEIDEVEIEFNDGTFGVYRPEDCKEIK